MAKKKTADADDGAKKKKGGKLKALLVGLLVMGLAYQFVLKKPADTAKAGEVAEVAIEEGESVPVPELTLNLADQDQLRYLRVGVALILEKGVPRGDVESDLAKASDVVISVLSAKTFQELHQPEAKEQLKAELSEKVRAAYDDSKVARVIFTSFVMQ